MFQRITTLLLVCFVFLVISSLFQTVFADTETNKVGVRRAMEELISQGKLELADELYAPTFTSDSVPGAQGPEAARLMTIGFRAASPDVQIKVEDQIAEGALVATRWSATGTHRGEWAGIPPTGVKWTIRGIDIQHLVGGKIDKSWDFEDVWALMEQLGVIPTTGTPDYTWGKPLNVTGNPGTPKQNEAIVFRTFEELQNQGNLAVVDEVYAPGYVNHYIEFNSLEALKQNVSLHLTAFPDFHVTVEEQIAEGDKVVTRWVVTGTHTGENSRASPQPGNGYESPE